MPTSEVDVMMGTFTKSFGGMGGYIAADKKIIDYLRVNCAGLTSLNSLSPIITRFLLFSLLIGSLIGSLDG